MDQLSRSIDPDQEALQQLMYQLETSDVARKAFGAEMIRNRQFAALCRGRRRDLPNKVAEALDSLADRSPSFEVLLARAEAAGEASPQLEIALPEKEST